MGTPSKMGPSPLRGEYLKCYTKKDQHISDAEGQRSDSDNFINPSGRNGFVALHTKAYGYWKVFNPAALICLKKSVFMDPMISKTAPKKQNGSTPLGL